MVVIVSFALAVVFADGSYRRCHCRRCRRMLPSSADGASSHLPLSPTPPTPKPERRLYQGVLPTGGGGGPKPRGVGTSTGGRGPVLIIVVAIVIVGIIIIMIVAIVVVVTTAAAVVAIAALARLHCYRRRSRRGCHRQFRPRGRLC